MLLAELLQALASRTCACGSRASASPETRGEYREELTAYLRAHEDELAEEVRNRIDLNPMRAFDATDPRTRETMRGAPKLLDRLAPDDAEHFAQVRSLLDDAGVRYELDPTLVRGLDYYTRTLFEFTSDALGAQSGVAGGGRYDRLIEQLDGPPTPASGWAAGVERMLLAASAAADVAGDRRPVRRAGRHATAGAGRRSSSRAARAGPGWRRSSSWPAAR